MVTINRVVLALWLITVPFINAITNKEYIAEVTAKKPLPDSSGFTFERCKPPTGNYIVCFANKEVSVTVTKQGPKGDGSDNETGTANVKTEVHMHFNKNDGKHDKSKDKINYKKGSEASATFTNPEIKTLCENVAKDLLSTLQGAVNNFADASLKKTLSVSARSAYYGDDIQQSSAHAFVYPGTGLDGVTAAFVGFAMALVLLMTCGIVFMCGGLCGGVAVYAYQSVDNGYGFKAIPNRIDV